MDDIINDILDKEANDKDIIKRLNQYEICTVLNNLFLIKTHIEEPTNEQIQTLYSFAQTYIESLESPVNATYFYGNITSSIGVISSLNRIYNADSPAIPGNLEWFESIRLILEYYENIEIGEYNSPNIDEDVNTDVLWKNAIQNAKTYFANRYAEVGDHLLETSADLTVDRNERNINV